MPPPASRRGIPPAVWAAGAGVILLVLLFALAGRRRTPQAPAPSREAPAAPRERSRPPAAPSPAPRSSGADPAPLREAVAALEQETRTAAERAEYGKALARLESERARHAAPEWGQAVDRLTREIRDGAGGRFVRLKPKAIDARQQGNEDAVDAFRAEVAAWGIPSFVEELDQAIEAVPSPRSSARLCAGIPPESFAGTQGPFDLDGDGAVRNWLIAGPFPNPDVSGGLHVDYLDGETRHVPKAGREVRAPSGASVAWTPYAGTNRVIELKKLPQLVLNGSRDHLLAYAACWLECEADVRTEVRIGSDDGYKLWVDSALVGQKDGDRGYRHDQESYPVRLAKGRHLLLLKIYNYTSGYQFGLRLVSSSGSPPRGLRVWN